ncbi:MAG: 30S ribosomal protein S17 [Candidatus Levybacteria bacterium RIFOXYA1_FULL_41_10]|nr:MAG: 30S ribosomal protein S17 [Candidatus Levybacteria bacterium GW2011_GWA1_39_34]KKR50659.1 MAG: 30S ribosomal protein S17 [Candidatus Levybacteria bacterium GW2011_GWC1_40_19]KKR72538.1 MAG: 30S ribosomal protein S17 [Candidatus Levybacteria bacterium GW2011_GWC2_40_7]KKR95344.1 MAG: 30S ribosomal protein S17 [Candidatus Levybacteria bacterium GW2011_GWA2_41_15]KKS01847.1 MAG: 30S ribosomal protein S17 [Candidatus Levybacteria bacterium GW2011_GWB1_41_21]OGH20223.1 MAG: 30S ribosomal pr
MKTLEGVIVSLKMQNTAVVEVAWRTPHPLYKKLMKKSKKYKVDTSGLDLSLGQIVKIVETKPISKDKHFKVLDNKKKESK